MVVPHLLVPNPPCSITELIRQPFANTPPEQLILFEAIEMTYLPGASWNVAGTPSETVPKALERQLRFASIIMEVDASLTKGTIAESTPAMIFVRIN